MTIEREMSDMFGDIVGVEQDASDLFITTKREDGYGAISVMLQGDARGEFLALVEAACLAAEEEEDV